ncbi:hypothetical protein [Saccharothrix hoggarensis]|uniref:Uncharacterized protein n=1 Tax=Saccharothrix hoggarensis TaxID=913853 RepID=A0ABW3QP36_9PSEU
MLSTNPDVQVAVGTASRACPTPTHCTYYNTALSTLPITLNL